MSGAAKLDYLLIAAGNNRTNSELLKPSLVDIISAMVADVIREVAGEIVDGKDVHSAIGARTVKLFKANLNRSLRPSAE